MGFGIIVGALIGIFRLVRCVIGRRPNVKSRILVQPVCNACAEVRAAFSPHRERSRRICKGPDIRIHHDVI